MQIPFQSSERSSLGVEWELQLVDLETRELSAGAIEILEEIRPEGAEEHPKAKHELLQSTIEIITGICTTVDEAKADLAGTPEDRFAAACTIVGRDLTPAEWRRYLPERPWEPTCTDGA